LGPCTFAYMAPMLAVAFKVAGSKPVFSILLLVLYGVGHCAVIVAAGTFTQVVQRYLNWNERSRGGAILRGACGVLVLVAGLYLIYVAH
jgi:cytochrome c-type biogenesis protein